MPRYSGVIVEMKRPKPTREVRKLWNFLYRVQGDGIGCETPEKAAATHQAVERIRDEMRYLWDMSADEDQAPDDALIW